MKGKSDLVRGWLKKAASDLAAMLASAKAGATDAACFHAQQAAEKYLKAFLLDRNRELIHTHNLHKLVNFCEQEDASFGELIGLASLLTPFAIEARYDTEFWPSAETVHQAEQAAQTVAAFVSRRIQSLPSNQISPVAYQRWKEFRDRFNWTVDLRLFKSAASYPGFFDRIIEPEQTLQFEDDFRYSLVSDGRLERAAEVAFWKNFGMHQARDSVTRDLLEWLQNPDHWIGFVAAVRALAASPTWNSFRLLQRACGQPSGFAIPITFVSFCDPLRFPLVDKRIGLWWQARFPTHPQFSWSGKVIAPKKKSWAAYLAWVEFCRAQAEQLSIVGGVPWRARDVEIAVWADRDFELPL